MPDDGRGASPDGVERPGPVHPPVDERQRRALGAALALAAEHGLDPVAAGIWRAGSSVLVGLPGVPAVVRVDDPARTGDAVRQVRIAAALGALGVPSVRVVGPAEQPVASPAGPLTVWAWEPPSGPPVGPEAMGAVARRLHAATRTLGPEARSAAEVPAHEPLVAVRLELDRAVEDGGTVPSDIELLREAAVRIAGSWPDPGDDPLGPALVHGDLHRGNVVAGRSGPVLADLELAGWGAASADVAPQVVGVRRYGADPADLDRFLAAYGADPRGWPGLEVLVEAYELWVTAWAVANRTASTRWEREAELRLQRWRVGTSSSDWSLG